MPTALAVAGLAGCDRQPVVVNNPPQPMAAVPGPPGPPGPPGDTGDTGKAGQGTTVSVVPPASSNSN